jgi:hypothetical protein
MLYAFSIEPSSSLNTQTSIWHTLAVLCAGLLSLAAYKNYKNCTKTNITAKQESPKENISKFQIIKWAALSAIACTTMIAATYLIAGEIGSSPLAWTGPFGLYLLAFAIAFTGIIKKESLHWITLPTVLFAIIYFTISNQLQFKTMGNPAIRGELLIALLNATFFACLLALSVLHYNKPKQRFDIYYITLAIGGTIGGILSTFVIPNILHNPIEFPSLLIITCLIGITHITKIGWHGIVLGTSTLLIPLLLNTAPTRPDYTITNTRDIHGHLTIQKNPEGGGNAVRISSHSTLHGSQYSFKKEIPTTYYSKSSPVGRLFENRNDQPLRVGIIGLGAGTIAAYATEKDHFTFWDIDPKAIKIAQEDFTYVKDSPGKIELIEEDGRIGLQKSQEDFDILIVDAYTGDAIPPQLLTKEGLEIYKNRLEKRNGRLLIHHSTRYSNYDQVLTNTASSIGLQALHIESAPTYNDWDASTTKYTLIAKGPVEELLESVKSQEKLPRDIYHLDPKPHPIRTDQYNSLLHVLSPAKLLKH